jgi:predicted alpha/beta-hydrolase family hydrolase
MLLPGFGYTLDMPLFYYAENLLLERGWDVLRVEYAYSERPEFGVLPRPEQRRWLLADAEAAYRAARADRAYSQIALVGKSLGTAAMGHLLTLPEARTEGARTVWLTPMLSESRLREQIAQFADSSLFVIGTADPHYDPAILAELTAATNGEAVGIDDADHGMDIPGDPVASAPLWCR